MQVFFNMDAASLELRNELCLLAQRWQPSLMDSIPGLRGVSFGLRHVERHVLPFSSKPQIKTKVSEDGSILDFTVLLHREVPDKMLRELIETEMKIKANAN